MTPNAEDEARIAREQALMAPAWKAWPEGLVPSLAFQQPTPGGLTGSFGLRRIFNGEPRAPHAGLTSRPPRVRPCAPRRGRGGAHGDFFFAATPCSWPTVKAW